jgi:hypothetical protein
MAKLFTITLYPPDGSLFTYTASTYGFQEGGRLIFTDSQTKRVLITTLPYFIQPESEEE